MNFRLNKLRTRRAIKDACRRAQLIANLSDKPHVVRLDRLNGTYRIAPFEAFRDADTTRIFWPA